MWRKRRPTEVTIWRLETIFSLLTVWTRQCKWEWNENIPAFKPLKLNQALIEVGMTKQQFHYALRTYPALADKYAAFREIRRSIIKDRAEDNLDRAISWKMQIDDTDLANLSLKFLEKTDKAYSPKQEIEVTSNYIDLSEEELKQKILELMNA